MNTEGLYGRKEFLSSENFMKNLLFSSTYIIRDSEFKKYGLNNKNLMFFLNIINEKMSSISMLGCRNICPSLLGKLNNLFEYNDNIKKQFENKNSTVPDHKITYVKEAIINSAILDKKLIDRYKQFLGEKDDEKLIENFKMIYKSIIENKYFENISDELYELIKSKESSFETYSRISELSDEYFALLIDYVGISVYEIKRIVKDAYAELLKKNKVSQFYNMFSNFADTYKKSNKYYIFIKIDKEFDEKLLTTLRQSNNNSFMMLSKSGLIKKLKFEFSINNKKTLDELIKKMENSKDNNYYISSCYEAKDLWQSIKLFKEKTIQPFIGSMLYSGQRVNVAGKYIVVENRNLKHFINEYEFFDDIYKPLSQDFPDYSDIFKRYIIETDKSEINKIIDESVQLLPYYNNNNSILTKFTNTWFALETLFRNAGDTISTSMKEYAANLVADRMLSGYIYVTALQIKRTYKNFKKYSNKKIQNYLENFRKTTNKDCVFLEWKLKNLEKKIEEYPKTFDKNFKDARDLLINAYYLRNKQFHGSKDSQMELSVGYIYDIVNDAISFYIDYLDVYRGEKDLKSLFNYVRNIKTIKNTTMAEQNIDEKIMIAFDAVRKI